MYWAWWQANYWNMLVVVLLQCSYVWRYHQSTLWASGLALAAWASRAGICPEVKPKANKRATHPLPLALLPQVEQSVLSFNKSLENSEGLADFQAAHAYLTSGRHLLRICYCPWLRVKV